MNEKSRPCKAADLIENCFHYSGPGPIYAARLAGWLEGYHSRDAEIQRLEWTCDRLYTWALSRTPAKFNDQPAYSSLERIRGNSATADRIDAANAARFEQVTP